jgi:hypothetical protein
LVLAIAVAFLVRIGLRQGFERYELPALGLVAALLMFYPVFGAPTGFGATLVVSSLIARRSWPRRELSDGDSARISSSGLIRT